MHTIQHQGDETFIEHGTPGTEGHWRVLYIKWTDGKDDSQPGLAIEEVLDALLQRVAHVYPEQHAPQLLSQMLSADKYELSSPETEELGSDGTHLSPLTPPVPEGFATVEALTPQGTEPPLYTQEYHTE